MSRVALPVVDVMEVPVVSALTRIHVLLKTHVMAPLMPSSEEIRVLELSPAGTSPMARWETTRV